MVAETNLPIVVGVDGSEHSDRAVRYGVEEARRRGTGLTLVHAVHETAPMAAMLPLYSVEAFAEVGQRLVHDAERLVHGIDRGIEVGTSVQAGSRVGVLVDAGEHASLVVIGHRSRSMAGRVLTHSTSTGVAARAHCPVVSVPEAWAPGGAVGRVVVGVDESDASHDALDLAFKEARRRKAALVALHAWRLPTAYVDMGYSQLAVDESMGEARGEIEKIAEPFREVYSDVDVEISVQHDYPGPALLEAAQGADVVVVGRRGHGAPLGIYLGSLARMLIREGTCPVEVAPQHPRHALRAEDRLLAEDQIAPQL
ncbi:MAG TPA: universal stress protein [Nocardioidaceae bacterium]|nr:universal stress protein [Nocardioidaceae bacterium]